MTEPPAAAAAAVADDEPLVTARAKFSNRITTYKQIPAVHYQRKRILSKTTKSRNTIQ